MEKSSDKDIKILIILTLAAHMEFITATIKKIRMRKKLAVGQTAYVKIQLFDGAHLIEERQSTNNTGSSLLTTPLRNRLFFNNGIYQKRFDNNQTKKAYK